MGVQNDIYRRMEALKANTEQAEINKRHTELSEWIGAYHSVVSEGRGPDPLKPSA